MRDLDWHPSGKFLCVACEDATALQWIPEKQTTMALYYLTTMRLSSLVMEPMDQLVSLDGANIVRVWDIETGLVEQQHQLVDQFDAQQVDVLVEFSPQDDRISAGAAAPSSIWQTGDGSLVDTVHGSYLNWSFDGAYLASKYNETVTVLGFAQPEGACDKRTARLWHFASLEPKRLSFDRQRLPRIVDLGHQN